MAAREKGRSQAAGWVGDGIYGINDGLGSVLGIVPGVSGATLGNSHFVLIAGMAGMVASAELELSFPGSTLFLPVGTFDPAKESARFRVAGTDCSSYVIDIPLMKRFLALGSRLSLDLLPLSEDIFTTMEHGRFDLLLYADDGNIPANLQQQPLYEEDFVCVVSAHSRFKRRLTEEQYLRAKHVGAVTLAGAQTIPEQTLAEAGVQRDSLLRVPSFDLAMQMVVDSDLVATVPRRLTTVSCETRSWKGAGRSSSIRLIPVRDGVASEHER